jgi:beta-mannosidase
MATNPLILTLSSGWELQDAGKVSDAPAAISQPRFATAGWYKATVPGTVLTSLVNDGVYPEPLYGENNRPDVIPDSLCRTSYWYRTVFTAPARDRDRHLWLNFDGINYIAHVWVNGRRAGTVKGAFARGTFDITDFVAPREAAALAVEITPPPNPGIPHEHTQALGTGHNGGVLAQDGPTFLCSIGWDWIPPIRDRNIGIWQKVWLSQTGPVVIENPLVTSDLPLPRTDSADLTVAATVHNVSDRPRSGVLAGSVGVVSFEREIPLQPRESRLVTFAPANTPQLRLQNPRLWWPNTYGLPNLYTLNLRFDVKPGSSRAPSVTSDWRDVTFGIRKITYAVEGSENLTVSVNGAPIICKGGNWGMDEAMKRIGRERLEAQIRMHQLANYTMIRNWVGQSTSEDFYDLCDRYGLLVWDEFFQPNPSDGPDPKDADLYIANVREKVLRFRNHPCIALWCARNEGDPPPEIDAALRKIMAELEPQRLYHPNSSDGRGVKSGGPYSWRPPSQFYHFPLEEAFKTELGSVSIPTLQAIQAMMPEKDWNTFNDDWAEHDLCKGAQNGAGPRGYPRVIAERYGATSGLADFVRQSQLANYEAYRAMYEGRFARLFQPVTGILTWMSNPAQPSMVWQLYSHDLEPNASLFAVRKACEPIHIQMNQDNWHVMVINATPMPLTGMRARVRVFNMDAALMYDKKFPVAAAAGRATDIGTIVWVGGLSKVHFIKVELSDKDGHLISDNFYWRTLAVLPAATTRAARSRGQNGPREDFRDLQAMPAATIDVTFTRRDAGSRCLIDAKVSNRGPSIALLTHIQLRRALSNDRVLPVFYSDNYLSLLPSESRTIHIEAASADLAKEQPSLAVDGWNVKGPGNRQQRVGH